MGANTTHRDVTEFSTFYMHMECSPSARDECLPVLKEIPNYHLFISVNLNIMVVAIALLSPPILSYSPDSIHPHPASLG
nr:hypothetical protein BgiMline_029037 [Biomphalaria glabrata]